MYLIKFLCHKRSIGVATFITAFLTYATIDVAFGQTVPAATLNFAAQSVHKSSAAQTFTVRGSKLTEPVTVSTNAPFSLSKDSVNYTPTLTYTVEELASNQTVYVKFKPTVIGNYADSVANTSSGADNKIVALSGIAVESTNMMDGNKLDANNIITPNGDGRNDTWVIKNIDQYPNNTVKVFDKSRNVIYSKQGYTNDWNGTYNDAPLPQGTYYYVVDFGPGSGLLFKGFITIVRD